MKFNNVYVEKEIINSVNTNNILDRIKYNKIIICEKYSEVFNPKNQNFRIQKKNPSLILAQKKKKIVFKTPSEFTIGFEQNYYFSHMLNCVYDCKYCFLQGMFNSANYLIFVNYEDFFNEISKTIKKNHNKKICFFSGYDCDSLALENITNFASNFINFFKNYNNAFLEIRTKSINIKQLINIKPIKNVIVAYSINPQKIIKEFEQKTPNFDSRLNSLKKIQDNGWNIGLRFDPIFITEKNKKDYFKFLEKIFTNLKCSLIHSITIGKFRMSEKFLKKIIKIRPEDTLTFNYLMKNTNKEREIIQLFYMQVQKYIDKKKIFFN
ncbi:MAG: DNA photolyase [Alphaproteobacteria bacterium]|nr:DNA photolyase [Alphaproteobacteria bacterium]